MTPDQMAQLTQVNAQDNDIPYVETPGPGEKVDWWTDVPVPGKSFVCRDYCLKKADDLKALGWPAGDLTIILCWVEPPTRGYHAVLGVTVDGEKWILDSRADAPYRFENPSPNLYTWDREQIPGTTEFRKIV